MSKLENIYRINSNLFYSNKRLSSNSSNSRFNFDGYLIFEKHPLTGKGIVYTQFFRNGIIEIIINLPKLDKLKQIFVSNIVYEFDEENILAILKNYLKLQIDFEVAFPVMVLLSIVEITELDQKDKFMYYIKPKIKKDNWNFQQLDRNYLIATEILIEEFSNNLQDLAKIMKPIFDQVWNAAGYSQSLNYDQNGNWNPSR